jgi:hypothetical protein
LGLRRNQARLLLIGMTYNIKRCAVINADMLLLAGYLGQMGGKMVVKGSIFSKRSKTRQF